jgi:hypothetical protein
LGGGQKLRLAGGIARTVTDDQHPSLRHSLIAALHIEAGAGTMTFPNTCRKGGDSRAFQDMPSMVT